MPHLRYHSAHVLESLSGILDTVNYARVRH